MRINATLGYLSVYHFGMYIDREALRKEHAPKVREMAARKVARTRRTKGQGIVDENTILGNALSAFYRAVDRWPGAGEFG
ncbi:MAG TPA: hypothetical protein VMF69_17510, partial [Gemmataceae bacterium]|nr:hypothetical protein [Gemmataceae bacterium]